LAEVRIADSSRNSRKLRKAPLALVLLLSIASVRLSHAETVHWSAQGAANNQNLGGAIAVGSDITGDGIPDIAVGSAKSALPGEVTVRSSATGAVVFTLTGTFNSDLFGLFLDYVPDVNGDGFNDLVVGAPATSNQIASHAYIKMYSGLNGNLLWTVQSPYYGDLFGTTVRYAGDVNHDGVADVIFGAPLYSASTQTQGRVYVLSGSNGATIWNIAGSSTTTDREYGEHTAGVGDVNGDGYDDFVHTQYGTAGSNGVLTWRSGQTGSVIRNTCVGPETYPSGCLSSMGSGLAAQSSIANLGDVNGDNVPDIAIATASTGPTNSVQIVIIRSGASDSVIRILPTSLSDGKSQVVKNVGDINGDGVADLLQSAVKPSTTEGRILCYSGKSGALLFSFRGPASETFGASVDSPGDVDGDGVIDVVVGSSGFDNTYTNAGKLQMFTAIRMAGSCSYLWLDSDVPACLL